MRQSPLAYQSVGLVTLRLGWYVDYNVDTTFGSAVASLGMDYVPIVHVKQLKVVGGVASSAHCYSCSYVTPYTYTVTPSTDQLASLAASHPGLVWVIGNEIERRDWSPDGTYSGQDEILPQEYALAYHDAYYAIKNADSTAKVAIGSMVQWTTLRQQYMQSVWDTYTSTYSETMPVDVWNLHIFVLQEKAGDWGAGIPAGSSATVGATYSVLDDKDFSIAWSQIVAMRTWMANHGQQSKPLILTEYGVLFPDWVYPGQFTPEQVRDSFMYPSFNYFLNQTNASIGYPNDGNRLVQRWIWYSLDDDTYGWNYDVYDQNYNGNLFNSGHEIAVGMTSLGTYWEQYVDALSDDSASHY